MAFFSIPKVKITGISAALPKNKVSNFDLVGYENGELKKLISTIGIESRRMALKEQCASDLCIAAANKLIVELNWRKSEIEVIFFVSQTPDYNLPGTSMYIQEQLGLPKSCVTFDINQGCAGYVYGLSLISAFLSSTGMKKGLLLVGDTITKIISPEDKSLAPIFSDCGTATALMSDSTATEMHFNMSTEGADYEAIIVPQGGARNPVDESSLNYATVSDTVKRKGTHLAMKGLDVFNFSLKKVTPNVEEVLSKAGVITGQIDYFIFHQANLLIIEAISKKLNVPADKVPTSLRDYGNTSGATIPLTIVSKLRKENRVIDSKMLLSGFGVGLSLGAAIVDFQDVLCAEIIEI
jgi:3-oxoacyl-[acyl-carrier-protein] synthase-3